jgi:hypothetical protein
MKNLSDIFNFRTLQETATVLKTLQEKAISIEDFLTWVQKEKHKQRESIERGDRARKAFISRLPKCPDCAAPMSLAPANPEDPSEGSHWTCPKCRYGRYDERPPDQIHQGLIHKTEEELRRDKKRAKRRQTATAKRRAVKERCDGDHKTT